MVDIFVDYIFNFFNENVRFFIQILLEFVPKHPIVNKSALTQVKDWQLRKAPSHYLSQSSPRSLMPYGITRPQWVKKELVPHNLLMGK